MTICQERIVHRCSSLSITKSSLNTQYLNIALDCVITEKKEDNPIKNNRVVLILVTSYYIILELQEFLMMQIIKLLPSRHPI